MIEPRHNIVTKGLPAVRPFQRQVPCKHPGIPNMFSGKPAVSDLLAAYASA
jgi:hypothetical protein